MQRDNLQWNTISIPLAKVLSQTKAKRRYTRLTTSEWDSIVALYETGASTLAELSARYTVSISNIMNQAKARSVKRRAAFPATAALSIVTAATASPMPATAKTIIGIRSSAYATQEEKITATNGDAYTDALAIQQLIRCAVAALPAAPATPQEAAAVVRAADMAAVALDRCNRIRRTVLRLDKLVADIDTPLPELPIFELTDMEVEVMRAQQARDDREAGLGDADAATRVEPERLASESSEIVEEIGESY